MGCGWAFSALHLGTAIVLAMLLPFLAGQSVSKENKFLVFWSALVLFGLWLNHAFAAPTWCRVLVGLTVASLASVICFQLLSRKMGWSILDKIRRRIP